MVGINAIGAADHKEICSYLYRCCLLDKNNFKIPKDLERMRLRELEYKDSICCQNHIFKFDPIFGLLNLVYANFQSYP